MKPTFIFVILSMIRAALPSGLQADEFEGKISRTRFSVNFQNTEIRKILELIASRAGLHLRMEGDTGGLITVNQTDATAQELLDRLSQDQQIEYSVHGDELLVTKRGLGTGTSAGIHHLPLRFANAADIGAKLQPIIPAAEKMVIDEPGNTILFVGSQDTWRKVSAAVGFLDVAPVQILIETQIIETSNQFMRNIGVSLGAQSQNGQQSISTSNPIAAAAALKYSGVFSGAAIPLLDVKLEAAVSKGEARVVSRPKVLTLNNQHAKIESGVEIHVKTLSTAISNPTVPGQSVSTGTPGLSATTGVTTLNAGLTLDILPSVVGSNMIRLTTRINDSQPDNSALVDGIPNIQNNSASTTILVKNGETAVIAGLVKQSKGNTTSGVPILSDIPLIGALFRSVTKSDNNNELVIFITPKIDEVHIDTGARNSGSNPES